MNKKAIIITAIATSIGAALGTFVVKSLMGDNTALTIDTILVQAAYATNKTLPMMVDKDTRLDATVAGPGNRFTYSYTLINYTKKNLDIPSLKQYIGPRLLASYKSLDQMKSFRDNHVELNYQYKDKDGVFLFAIDISPKDF